MQLQVQAKSKTFVEEWEADAGADAAARRSCRRPTRTGFFYVAVCDHLAVTKPLDDAHADHLVRHGRDARAGSRRSPTNVRVMSHVYVHELPPPAAHREVVHDARRALGRTGDPRRRRRAPPGRVRAARARLRRPRRASPTTRSTWSAPRSPTSTPTSTRRAGATSTTRGWRRGRASSRCRSGSADRRSRRCDGPRERGDGWLPQGTPRAEMPDQIAFLLEHRKQTARRRADRPRDDHRVPLRRRPGLGRRRAARCRATPTRSSSSSTSSARWA